MNDMVTIFNQLTHTELADCYTFENIVECHYRKFVFVYGTMLRYLDLSEVKKITCKDTTDGLCIKITYNKNNSSQLDIFTDITTDDFELDITNSKDDTYIEISNMDGKREAEDYENRSNRYKKVGSRK